MLKNTLVFTLLSVSSMTVVLTPKLVGAAPIISITSFDMNVRAREDNTAFNYQNYSTTAWGSDSVSESHGGSTATTNINFVDTTFGAEFDFDFIQSRMGSVQSFASTSSSTINTAPIRSGFIFTTSEDTTYSLSGLFSSDAANHVNSYVELVGLSGDGLLFTDNTTSRNTANESFTLGVSGDGDFHNATSGSLTGILLAGYSYRLTFQQEILAFNIADNGATATGCLTLSIGDASANQCGVGAVPVPAAVWLFGSGLIGLIGLARRKSNH